MVSTSAHNSRIAFLLLLRRGKSVYQILFLASVLYLIGLTGDSYYGIVQPLRTFKIFDLIIKSYEVLFGNTRNGVFMGLLFVSIGALFAYKPIALSKRFAIGGLVFFELLLFFEVYLLKREELPRDYNMYFFLPAAVFFLFYIATHWQLRPRAVYRRLRVIGMLIFYSHLFVTSFYGYGIKVVERLLGVSIAVPFLRYVCVAACATAFGALAEWLSRKEKYHWIQYFWS